MPDPSGTTKSVEPRAFRDVMGRFATGVAVVTTEVDGTPYGMTVNSLTSLSLEPPLLLVCLTTRSRTAKAVTTRGAFVVNLLTRWQRHLSDQFARPSAERFANIALEVTADGLPAPRGCAARIECEVDAVYPGGDHLIVIGRVRSCRATSASPLLYYRGRYHRLGGPGHDDLGPTGT